MQKWNYSKHIYEPYTPPEGCVFPTLFTPIPLKQKINCVSCNKKITFGRSYTSLEIHDSFGYGFGYPVCKKCYDEEFKRYFNTKDLQNERSDNFK